MQGFDHLGSALGRLEARRAGSATVTRVELLEPLETLPDSKAVTSQNSRSSELLDEPLGELLNSEPENKKTKNNLFGQGGKLGHINENKRFSVRGRWPTWPGSLYLRLA